MVPRLSDISLQLEQAFVSFCVIIFALSLFP
jgi:hypothetical protein